MDDKTKTALKIAAAAASLALLYWWLQTSGKWAQWFGMPNEFTDAGGLLEYCRKCVAQYQGGAQMTAVFIDPGGARHTATCARWLSVNPGSDVGAGSRAGDVNSPASGPDAQRLRDAAIASPILGTDSANLYQWNYLARELDSSAPIITNPGLVQVEPGVSDVMDAATYAALRQQYLAKNAAVQTSTIAAEGEASNPYQAGWVN